ncbi:hypothetical protein ACFL5N_01305 [bacterium]
MKKILSIILLSTMSLNLAGSNSVFISNNLSKPNVLMLKAGISPFKVLETLEAQKYKLSKDKNLQEYMKQNVLEYLKKNQLSVYAINEYKNYIQKAEKEDRDLYEIYKIIQSHLKARDLFRKNGIKIFDTCFFYERNSKGKKHNEEKMLLQEKSVNNKIHIYDYIIGRKIGELDKDIGEGKYVVVGDKIFVLFAIYKSKRNGYEYLIYNITDKKKVDIKSYNFPKIEFVGGKIFAIYQQTKDEHGIYNITDKKKVNIKSYKPPKIVFVGGKIFVIFAIYKSKKDGYEIYNIYNITDKKKVDIKSYNFPKIEVEGGKILAIYKAEKDGYETDGKKVSIKSYNSSKIEYVGGKIFAIFTIYQLENGYEYVITDKKKVDIKSVSSSPEIKFVGSKIFDIYQIEETAHGIYKIYDITDGTPKSYEFPKIEFVGGKIFIIFAIYKPKRNGYEYLIYNITDKKKVDIESYKLPEIVFVGGKIFVIFVIYKSKKKRYDYLIYNITDKKKVDIKSVSSPEIKFVGSKIFAIYQIKVDYGKYYTYYKIYNITDGKKLPKCYSYFPKIEYVGGKIFAMHFTTRADSGTRIEEGIFNITDNKQIIFVFYHVPQKIEFIGGKIFAIYKIYETGSGICNIMNEEYLQNSFIVETGRYLIFNKQISMVDLETLKQNISQIKNNINKMNLQYVRDNYLSNILNISKYPILQKYFKYQLVHYLCGYLTNDELEIFSELLTELKPEVLNFLLQSFSCDFNNPQVANKIKLIISSNKKQERKQVFKKYIMDIYVIIFVWKLTKFMYISNDLKKLITIPSEALSGLKALKIEPHYKLRNWKKIDSLLKNGQVFRTETISITKIINKWKKQYEINKKVEKIETEKELLKFWRDINKLRDYLKEETGCEVSYADVLNGLLYLRKIIKRKKSLFAVLFSKKPLIIEEDNRGTLIEVNGVLIRKYKNGRRTLVVNSLLNELGFDNWKIFRHQIKIFFPEKSVNKILRFIWRIFKNAEKLSQEELDVNNYWYMTYSV